MLKKINNSENTVSTELGVENMRPRDQPAYFFLVADPPVDHPNSNGLVWATLLVAAMLIWSIRGCNGLNVYIPSKFLCCNPNPQYDGIGRRVLWEIIRS